MDVFRGVDLPALPGQFYVIWLRKRQQNLGQGKTVYAYTQAKILCASVIAKDYCYNYQYLKHKIAGANGLSFRQLNGALSPGDFKTFAQPYLIRIADELKGLHL